jgi:cysteine desulfurase
VERLGVDYLVLNGAKVSGPQGSALLYVRRGVPLTSIFLGGGQEFGHRAGTEYVAGIIGLGKALEIAQEGRMKYEKTVSELRDRLERDILATFSDAHVNGISERLPGHLNVTFPKIDHQYLALALGEMGIMVGTKSACRENDDGDSHVLKALREAGDGVEFSAQGIRISLGVINTSSDISLLHNALIKVIPLAEKSRTVVP